MSDSPPTIVQLTGPILVGNIIDWALYGVLSVQAYLYYIAFPKDRIFPTKALASAIYLFETAQLIIVTYDGFRTFALRYGDYDYLDDIGLSWLTVPIMGTIVAATIQVFYAWRIWILSSKPRIPIIPIIIVLLSMMQLCAGFYDGIYAFKLGRYYRLQRTELFVTPVTVWMIGTAASDVIIAVAMTYYLLRARSAVMDSDYNIVMRLISLSVETGSLCAVVAIVDFVMFLKFPQNNYHVAPGLALGKVYSNSLFAVLNARVQIIGGRRGKYDSPPDLTLAYARDAHSADEESITWARPSPDDEDEDSTIDDLPTPTPAHRRTGNAFSKRVQ